MIARALVFLAGFALPWASVLALPVLGARIALADVFAMIAIAVAIPVATTDDASGAKGTINVASGAPFPGVVRSVIPWLMLSGLYGIVGVLGDVFTNAYAVNIGSYSEIFQRCEILVVWPLFGALVVRCGQLRPLLSGFVFGCVIESFLWLGTPGESAVGGVQKNPSGGFIVSAILVVALSSLSNRWRLPLLLVLAGGLVGTGSRGSIVGLVAGLAVLLLFARQWKRLILPLASVCCVVLVALYFLPSSMVDRLLSRNADGRYTELIREVFLRDALETWARYPAGIGVGNYQQHASALQNISTHDPHNVFALQLVEGGWPLLVVFTCLTIGSILWLFRYHRIDVALLGVTIQVATLTHAWVDVYWVRGTPCLGWLLLGSSAAIVAAGRPSPWVDVSGPALGDIHRGRDREVGLVVAREMPAVSPQGSDVQRK